MFGSQSLFSTGSGAFLLWGALLFSGMGTSTDGGPGESPRFRAQPVELATARPDTTQPITAKPCSVDISYRDEGLHGNEITENYNDMGDYVAPSLHNLTCRWAQSYGHSTDPARLPKYVQPTGDSLQLSENALLYIVRMSSPSREDREAYLVAEVEDSLAYTHTAAGKYLRDVREVEVPSTNTRYIWVETVYISTVDSSQVRWRGHIFTYDRKRGIRYAARAPVRFEMFEEGESIGYTQVDVSIPRPGIMKIDWRDIPESDRLPTSLATQSNFHNWVGLHVIDRSETDKREYQEMPTTGSYVVVDSANATAWDRQSEYVMIR